MFPILVDRLPIPSLVQDFWVLYIDRNDEQTIFKACADLDRAITKHLQQRALVRTPRLFVSHRHKDESIAEALVALLEAAFEVSSADIRCTSVWPYRLRPGDRTPDRLRDEIRHADVVMGLLAPDTRESSYVLFELGAAWSQGRLTCPLLVRGATGADIPDPIKDLHPLALGDGRQCQELLDEIQRATALKRKEGVGGAVEDKVRKLVEAAKTS
ncbi:MAG: toll/interleukin-1 receptor domain-containing protein [Candidatus Solibacter sp.]